MIFVDSNIPMYLVGSDAGRRIDAQRWLERLVSEQSRLVTDAEVFQEVLHRYVAIERRDAIQPAFDVLLAIVDDVLPIDQIDVLAAKDILGSRSALSARDALHVAVMQRYEIRTVLSFDRDFDQVPGIDRLG
ncbi:MAG TPA: type II toxin-antitoxin system VapC family toxin [Nocardioidaceae bacterium]|nr:type II toxin-antitoxin system VapC family toxin [Actinomycetota bacterium]HEV8055937.1 type II toxin-antitoxin system VapC family toxin [Nocardioidaceae bacterium]